MSDPVDRDLKCSVRPRRHIEPPQGLDPKLARFIEELARAAVRREKRAGKVTVDELPSGKAPQPSS